jgi:hypothetical protein
MPRLVTLQSMGLLPIAEIKLQRRLIHSTTPEPHTGVTVVKMMAI